MTETLSIHLASADPAIHIKAIRILQNRSLPVRFRPAVTLSELEANTSTCSEGVLVVDLLADWFNVLIDRPWFWEWVTRGVVLFVGTGEVQKHLYQKLAKHPQVVMLNSSDAEWEEALMNTMANACLPDRM